MYSWRAVWKEITKTESCIVYRSRLHQERILSKARVSYRAGRHWNPPPPPPNNYGHNYLKPIDTCFNIVTSVNTGMLRL